MKYVIKVTSHESLNMSSTKPAYFPDDRVLISPSGQQHDGQRAKVLRQLEQEKTTDEPRYVHIILRTGSSVFDQVVEIEDSGQEKVVGQDHIMRRI